MAVSMQIWLDNGTQKELVYKSSGPSAQATTLSQYAHAIVSGKLKKETNKAASLEFMILPENEHYNDFHKMTTLVYVKAVFSGNGESGSKYLFRGRVTDIKTDIFQQRTISCEEDLAFLSDSVQPPNKRTGTETSSSTSKKKRNVFYGITGSSTSKDTIKMSVSAYFRSLINEHNSQLNGTQKTFNIGSITVSDANTEETFERTSYQDTSSVISSDLLSVYGGILKTRYSDSNGVYIDWISENDGNNISTSTQTVNFGINLVDLSEEQPCDEVWSVLLPVGDENITIAAANNGSKYLENSNAVNQYGRIIHYHKFENCETAQALLGKAQKYMGTHCKVYPNNITVTAVDLKYLGRTLDLLVVGEKIKVIAYPNDIGRTMLCIEMELDLVAPENNSYTIGTIMPPDKEHKKDSLSNKYSDSNRSGSNAANRAATAQNGMQNDMQVAANNINVNAQNIAVNAQNIAVNAENIAVVAKNISIAANDIDIKAQQLTATFENETGTLSNKITATANGIVGELENQTLSVKSKIELTASQLSVSFNKLLYGENQDGTGGLYADYTSKIQTSATNLTSTFDAKLYGANGTLANPTGGVVADYSSRITQSAQGVTSEVNKKLYGDNGTLANPTGGVVADYASKIEQSASSITNTVEENYVGKSKIASTINQTAQSVLIQAEKIDLSGYVTATTFSATNSKLTNLIAGTETATKIVATSAKVTTGTFEIGDSSNNATLKYRNTEYYSLSLSMPGVAGTCAVLGWAYNSNYQSSLSLAHSHSVTTNPDGTITLGGSVAVDSAASGRSFRIADTKAYQDGVSAATNAVTVSSLGRDYYNYQTGGPGTSSSSVYTDWYESSEHHRTGVHIRAALSNGNSREETIYVSGTSAYNDGVTDGTASVTVSSLGRNYYDYSSGTGTSSSTSYTDWYEADNSHRTAVRIRAAASNGNSKAETIYVSGTKAYNDGVTDGTATGIASVTVSSLGRNYYDYSSGTGTSSSTSYTDWYEASNDHRTAVRIRAAASNGNSKSETIYVSGSSAYNDGMSDGRQDAVSWFANTNYSSLTCQQAQADSGGTKGLAKVKLDFWNAYTWNWDSTIFNNVPMWDVFNEGADYLSDHMTIRSVKVFANGNATVVIDTFRSGPYGVTKNCDASNVTVLH